MLSDFLNLFNIIINIAVIQWFLGGQFVMYGFKFMEYQSSDVKHRGEALSQ